MRFVSTLTCILLSVAASLESVSEEEGSCSAVGSLGTAAKCTESSSGAGRFEPSPNNDSYYQTSLTHDLVSSNDPNCIDQDPDDCQIRALQGHCAKRPAQMLDKCPYSCALCNNHLKEEQQVRTCYGEVQNAKKLETLQHIRQMQEYMIRTVYVNDDAYQHVRVEVRTQSLPKLDLPALF